MNKEYTILSPNEARLYCKSGGRLTCLLCGRNKFTQPQPHKCNSGFRKRHIKWIKSEGDYHGKNEISENDASSVK